METVHDQTLTIEKFNIMSDIFSQAITGELTGMANFASLTDTIDDPYEKMEAVEHANSERHHAEAFLSYARKRELNVNINLNGQYWSRIRERFLSYAVKKDFIACLVIQEVMLESFAISMYNDVGRALGGDAEKLFLTIAEEEKEHLGHASKLLHAELKDSGDAFVDKFEKIHFECMSILSEFSATSDLRGHCGVCNGDCMKGSLHHVGLTVAEMRGNALALYAQALDDIGIPGEKSIVWIAKLPV